MKWNVYIFNTNKQKIEIYNIFEHSVFKKYVDKWLEECETRDEFAKHIKSELQYYFWGKCEYEIIISPWVGNKSIEEKIDVYDQVMNNFNAFLNYIWFFNGE